jgi:hypothetical protein
VTSTLHHDRHQILLLIFFCGHIFPSISGPFFRFLVLGFWERAVYFAM